MNRVDLLESALPGCEGPLIPGAVRVGERVFLTGASALTSDGRIVGPGDAAAQAHAALDVLERSLATAGGSLANLTKLTTCIIDRGFRSEIYRVIAERLGEVRPVSTGLIVPGLGSPELIVQIDAEAVVPDRPVVHVRPYTFESWGGQGFPWKGAMVVRSERELFIRGQTGSALDHSGVVTRGRSPADAAAQADLALRNLATLLGEAGASLDDVCKITVYIGERAYRAGVYPVIGERLGAVAPVSTGIVTAGFAKPEILFELDAVVIPQPPGRPHQRLRSYHSDAARYGTQRQPLGCRFSMAVVAGDRILLRGQTGVDLSERLQGAGSAERQAEQAMDNVAVLLEEAGAGLNDVVKATVYVTQPDDLAAVNRAVLARFSDRRPAFTTVVVKGLASPELLMEVDIVAVRPR